MGEKEGKARKSIREEKKNGRLLLRSNSTRQPDREHARTERNETKRFPNWAHPPTFDIWQQQLPTQTQGRTSRLPKDSLENDQSAGICLGVNPMIKRHSRPPFSEAAHMTRSWPWCAKKKLTNNALMLQARVAKYAAR